VAGPKRPREELEQLLAHQRKALASSCAAYDSGEHWEAERLANAVFTLFHDGGSIVSLLTQLGLLDSLSLISSGRIDVTPELFFANPTLTRVTASEDGTMIFIPRLGNVPDAIRPVDFQTWWKKEVIFYNKIENLNLTRQRLVNSMRHQDGGSHVGKLTDSSYISLRAGAGWKRVGENGDPAILAATASMRQVAWEVTETLKDW
jgi:hypothetical protein